MPVPETHEGDHPEPSKRNYLLNADGSGTGTTDNPAQGAIGVVLRDPDGHPIAEISKRIGPAINTVAEYRALIEGLKLAAVAESNASGCSLTRSSWSTR
jgi:ribonuclease H / adenosylcobalamin/alpha-ribazole phosphatase